MANYFECKVSYVDASKKKETELSLVKAVNYSDAEERITKEFESSDVLDIIIRKYKVFDVIYTEEGGLYFRCKVAFVDEDGKKRSVYYLVVAENMDKAKDVLTEYLKQSMDESVIEKIEETKLADIYE